MRVSIPLRKCIGSDVGSKQIESLSGCSAVGKILGLIFADPLVSNSCKISFTKSR